ncbi:MAG TPA: hypothetical protein VFQ63_00310 [Patescibacteria group bacterium]|nr:hypothetical protein [Patescibacteria group bacterium]
MNDTSNQIEKEEGTVVDYDYSKPGDLDKGDNLEKSDESQEESHDFQNN